jgi:hypothetical protein
MAEALPQLVRRRECLLDRDLLIEQHADQQGERIVDEELVGFGGIREMHPAIFDDSARLWRAARISASIGQGDEAIGIATPRSVATSVARS